MKIDTVILQYWLLDRMPFKLMNAHCASEGSCKRKIAESMDVSPMKKSLTGVSSKISDLIIHDNGLPTASLKTLSYIQSPCSLWLALDIKTHELIPNTDFYQSLVNGQFGHPCCVSKDNLQDLRIVQISWSIGHIDACSDPLTKSLLVKPDGFVISEAAAAKHGITTEKAMMVGSPISQVLVEFLSDFADVQRRFGRVCAHHLEFTMGIIQSEMQRAGIDNDIDAWSKAAINGFCTMNPDIIIGNSMEHTKHIRDRFLMDTSSATSLKDMVRILLTGRLTLLNQRHEAGAVSRMIWLVLRELVRLSTRAL